MPTCRVCERDFTYNDEVGYDMEICSPLCDGIQMGRRSAYSHIGITAEQYHAGVDKLWKALELTEVQDEDVFTLAAREITELRQEVVSLRDRIEGSVGD